MNDIVESALNGDPRSSWPAGSVIGWFFAEWEPDGEPDYAGFELDVCTDCHVSRNDRVRAFTLP